MLFILYHTILITVILNNKISLAQEQITNNINYKFKLSVLDSLIESIQWCDSDKNVILALTENQSLYISKDYGFNWQYIDQIKINKQVKNQRIGKVKQIVVSQLNKSHMIFEGTGNIWWRTRDCGKNIELINEDKKKQEFQFHPFKSDMLLSAVYKKCEDFDDECQILKELYLTKDFGESWELLVENVVQFSWFMYAYEYPFIEKQRIIASIFKGSSKDQLKKYDKRVDLYISDDLFKSKKILLERGNSFIFSENYLFGIEVLDEDKEVVRLHVTDTIEVNVEFRATKFPFEEIKEFSYQVLDSTKNQVFIQVNHQGQNSNIGNIYISNIYGSEFTLSLKNNVRTMEGHSDFEKVRSMDNVYLANVLYENHVQTRISFTKGGSWIPLKAPETDCYNKSIKCVNQECYLQLHSMSNSKYGPFYSTDNALGIIIGTGNVGEKLSNREQDVNTYLSRDGGVGWMEIFKGSHIYELGDHGGLLLLVDDQRLTDQAILSTDEGLTWSYIKISPIKVFAENIVISPGNNASYFLLYGKFENSTGFVTALDFTNYHPRKCNQNSKEEEDNDYELWTPVDNFQSECILGSKTKYLRKKRDRQCINGETFELQTFFQICQCSEQDWECDLGFSRINEGQCLPDNSSVNSFMKNQNKNQCVNGFITVSQGYRKLAADLCVGGVDYSPMKTPCFDLFSIDFSGLAYLLALALAVAVCSFGQIPDFISESKKQIINSIQQKKQVQYLNLNQLQQQPHDNNNIFDDN